MIYFLSDAHLGSLLLTAEQQHEQERRICALLDEMRQDATAVYLLGDMLDFWFEYQYVVPKGFVRFFGKLAELVDQGIEVHYFTGNHDIWCFDYLQREIGLKMHYENEQLELNGKRCYLAHGDRLPGAETEMGFRLIQGVFRNRVLQWMFRYLMPSWLGMRFGLWWSKENRLKERKHDAVRLKEDWYQEPETVENLPEVRWAKEVEASSTSLTRVDYYILGHRHVPVQLQLKTGAQVIILGDLMQHWTYGQLDDKGVFSLEFMA